MTDVKQVMEIVYKALRDPGSSKLSREAVDSVGGFISPNNRHLLNNLGAISTSYLEVGSHRGASLVSTGFHNDHLIVVGCDDFSQFGDPANSPEVDIHRNCQRFLKRYRVLKKSCWGVTSSDIEKPVDLFFSDGSHAYDDQKRAITHFVPFMANRCIVVVDDFSWDEPNAGTMAGFKESGVDILFAMTLFSGIGNDCGPRGFMNGLGVFVIQKPG